MNRVERRAVALLAFGALATSCGRDSRSAEPARLALSLLDGLESGRPLFDGEAALIRTELPTLSPAEARRRREEVEAAVASGDRLADARLRVAQRDFEGALRALDDLAGEGVKIFAVDRAAVFLERFRREGDFFDVVRALGALPLEVTSVEARYNRLIALEALELSRTARLLREGLESSAEARTVLELREVARAAPADDSESLSDATPDLETARRRLDAGDSQPIRLWFEREGVRRLLERDSESVAEARAVAAQIARATGDGLAQALADELSLDAVGHEPSSTEAARLWLESEAAFAVFRPEDALVSLRRAGREVRAPLSAWAARVELSAVACLFQLQRYDEAIKRAARLRASASEKGWSDVEGRARWLEGISLLQSGVPAVAQPHFRAGIAAFERAVEPGLAGNLLGLESDAWSSLGATQRALELRLESLRRVREAGLKRREEVGHQAAAEAMRKAEQYAAALAFVDEAALVFATERDSFSVAQNGWLRAAALLGLGDNAGALAETEAALTAAKEVESPAFRARLTEGVRALSGAARLTLDPQGAIDELSDAIGAEAPHGFLSRRSELLVYRAQAKRRLGSVAGAERDLRLALNEVEAGAVGVSSRFERALYFETKRKIVDEAVDLQSSVGAPEDALRWAFRLRGSVEKSDPRDFEGGGLCATSTVGALALHSLPDRLLRWVCESGKLTFDVEPVERLELLREIAALRRAIVEGGDASSISAPAARLFDRLLHPVSQVLSDEHDIQLILDGALTATPFAALRDLESGQWVAEMGEVIQVERWRPGEASPVHWGRDQPALVIADPGLEAELAESYPPLRGARAEAAAVAEQFHGSTVLTGAEATKERVLDRLRRAQIVHIAAHGVSDSDDPAGSALLLAGRGQEALLTASEIAELDLSQLRLVLLAACDSGSGFSTSALGSLGLSSAFLEAGATSVVGTHWMVRDDLAASFVALVYAGLGRGEPPARALRLARRSFLGSRDQAKSTPFQWAGYFVASNFGSHQQKGAP